MDRRCETCQWWNQGIIDRHIGGCRYAPPVIIYNGKDIVTKFPLVESDMWCSFWEEREK